MRPRLDVGIKSQRQRPLHKIITKSSLTCLAICPKGMLPSILYMRWFLLRLTTILSMGVFITMVDEKRVLITGSLYECPYLRATSGKWGSGDNPPPPWNIMLWITAYCYKIAQFFTSTELNCGVIYTGKEGNCCQKIFSQWKKPSLNEKRVSHRGFPFWCFSGHIFSPSVSTRECTNRTCHHRALINRD